jgi:hypothetical protein
MNERIKELYKQAGFTVARGWGLKDTVPEDVFIANVCVSNEMKKFAELIVAECVKKCEFVAAMAEITNTGEMARKTKATADSCAQMIGQHFGVEE